MRTVELHRYYLPNQNPRGKPYVSRWAMDEEEAAKRRPLGKVPRTRKVIQQAETVGECMNRAHTITSGSEGTRG